MSDQKPTRPTVFGGESPLFYEALGRAIKVMRAEQGLERKDLAEAAGVSYPYLAEIENGKKRPSSKALLAVAEALGVRPYRLLERAESLVAAVERDNEAFASPVEVEPGFRPAVASRMVEQSPTPAAAPMSEGAFESMGSPRAGDPGAGGGSWFRRTAAPRLPDPPLVASVAAGSVDDPLRELVRLAEGLPAEDLERLLDMARRLAR